MLQDFLISKKNNQKETLSCRKNKQIIRISEKKELVIVKIVDLKLDQVILDTLNSAHLIEISLEKK